MKLLYLIFVLLTLLASISGQTQSCEGDQAYDCCAKRNLCRLTAYKTLMQKVSNLQCRLKIKLNLRCAATLVPQSQAVQAIVQAQDVAREISKSKNYSDSLLFNFY